MSMAKVVTKREYRRRRVRFQIAAGLYDFIVTILCLGAALVSLLMLNALVEWLRDDIPVSFGTFWEIIKRTLKVNR